MDAFRYMVLNTYGGVYIDLDIGCLRSLNSLLENHAIIPQTKPFGYSNDFIMCEPHNPFIADLVENLPRFNLWLILPYLTVFYSTGPLFMSIVYRRYKSRVGMEYLDVVVLPEVLYSGSDSVSYFNHYEGSSWHTWDSDFVFLLWGILNRAFYILLLLIFLLVMRILWKKKFGSRVMVNMPIITSEDHAGKMV